VSSIGGALAWVVSSSDVCGASGGCWTVRASNRWSSPGTSPELPDVPVPLKFLFHLCTPPPPRCALGVATEATSSSCGLRIAPVQSSQLPSTYNPSDAHEALNGAHTHPLSLYKECLHLGFTGVGFKGFRV
jgi:hypothetical protein